MGIFKKNKSIEDLMPGFLLEKEISIMRKTLYTYQHATHVFLDWLQKHNLNDVSIRKITSDDISDFFYYLSLERKLDKPTCQKYFLCLRQIWKYAEKMGEVEFYPFDRVVFPRKQKDQGAEVIRPEDLKEILNYLKEHDPQLYLAAMVEFYCFIRPGRELRLLKVSDIDCDRGIITVRQENAKNKTKQTVTMPTQLIELCREFGVDTAPQDYFVFGKKGKIAVKCTGVNSFRQRFCAIRKKLNMPEGYKFYSMKHTGASMLHLSGISMRELMDQLRHTKLDATQHYLKKHCGIINERIRDNFPSPI